MSKHRKILFIDDDPAYREMIHRVAMQWGRDRWDVFLAENAGQALSLIQDQAIDLAVIDVEMPVVDGLQLLNLIGRKHPNVQKVVMTAFATEQNRSTSLAAGAELFLEKPRTVEGLESIFATLHELARWQPEQGFRGVLRQVSLQDVIQMECLSRHSVLLEVLTPAAQGEIFIQDGSVVHAQADHLTGEDAFNHLLCLSGGEFKLKPYTAPPARTLDAPWEFLLMEAARKRDEASEAAPSQVPTPALEPPMAPEPAAQPAPFSITKAALPDSPVAVPERPRTQVDEVLLCSPQGDVLYEWKCHDTATRIGLLEFVSQKARQIAQGLPLGRLDRVEMSCASSRLVVRIADDHGMLVRTSPYRHTAPLAMDGR